MSSPPSPPSPRLPSSRSLESLKEVDFFCLLIELSEKIDSEGSDSPTVVPPTGLKVCHCNSANICIDEVISNPGDDIGQVSSTEDMNSEVRICLTSPENDPLQAISFFQITQEDPSGGSIVIISYTGDDFNMDSTLVNGLLIRAAATYELQPDGQGAVITFPIDDKFFDPQSPVTTFVVSGVAILGDSEESFQLEFTDSTETEVVDDTLYDPSEDLNLSNTKEVGGEDLLPLLDLFKSSLLTLCIDFVLIMSCI